MKSGETKKMLRSNGAMDAPQSDLFARNCVLNSMIIIIFFVEIVKLRKIKGRKLYNGRKRHYIRAGYGN